MTAALDRAFLGVGWKFPPQVTPSGAIATSHHEQKIEESIYLVLGSARRERPMLPAFGCGIHDLVFAPDNPGTVAEVSAAVREALVAHEPRIDVLGIDVAAAPGQRNVLLIRIDYRVRANNARGNLVYPFFISEGV